MISFSSARVHASICYLSKDFTAAVMQNFLIQHPSLLHQVNRWMDNIINIQQKQKQQQQKKQFSKNKSPEQRKSDNAAHQRRQVSHANAQRQLVLDNAAPSTLADLARVTVESPNWFFNSHEDPTKSLLLFAYNSGHSFLPYVKDGVLPHSTECPAIMSETWTSDDNVPQDVRKLHAAILAQAVTQEVIDERVEQFRKQIPLEGLLLACAMCGVRDVFINSDDIAHDGQKTQQNAHKSKSSAGTSGNAPDLYALPDPPPPYVKVMLSDPLCEHLLLTQDQMDQRRTSAYRQIYTCYEHSHDKVYHLHPQLVDNPTGDPSIYVCQQCWRYLKKQRDIKARASNRKQGTQNNDSTVLKNTFAICEGYDFGDLSSAPKLSLLEKTLLARYVFYGVIIKLVALHGVRQSAIKGHCIAFSTTALSQIDMAATTLFPWFSDDEILSSIKVSFVGPSKLVQKCFRVLCLEDGLLRVNMKPLLWWLGLLKACHPGYSHIILPNRDQQVAAQSQMDKFQADILSHAQVVTNQKSRRVERNSGADIAAVRTLPEDHDALNSDRDFGSHDGASDESNGSESDHQRDGACTRVHRVHVHSRECSWQKVYSQF